ncbi:hypothetical protein U3516DRAFT_757042 [Neocallimastix sp. 'constans']
MEILFFFIFPYLIPHVGVCNAGHTISAPANKTEFANYWRMNNDYNPKDLAFLVTVGKTFDKTPQSITDQSPNLDNSEARIEP